MLFLSSLGAQEAVEHAVILGSGPAGLTAAIYTARAGFTPLVIEGEEPGGQIALSYTVENFPGFPEGINGFELTEKMRAQATRFGARLKAGKVVQVDLKNRPFKLTLEGGEQVLSKTVIITTGASANWLGLPSEKALIGKGVASCAVCDGALYKGKEVVVVGGGDSALEDALYLSEFASKVTIVHRREELKASKVLQERARSKPTIHLVLNTTVEEIKDPKDGAVTGVILKERGKEAAHSFPCSGVFIAIGHTPNTHLFKGQLPLTKEGFILTQENKTTETSIPGVFVAGDSRDPKYRQAVTAAGEGAKAGIDATHYLQHQN